MRCVNVPTPPSGTNRIRIGGSLDLPWTAFVLAIATLSGSDSAFADVAVSRHDPPRATAAPAQTAVSPADVAKLVEALGSSNFAERSRAESLLLQMGQDAYDAVVAAKDHPDLEVRERIRYIEQRLQISWVRPYDSPAVRKVMARYRTLNAKGRLGRLRILAKLPQGQGIAPLCRIARFDSYPAVAKRAALAVMELSDDQLKEDDALAKAIRVELASAGNDASQWIRTREASLADQADELTALAEAVDAELNLLDDGVDEVDPQLPFRLVRHQLFECRRAKAWPQLANALSRVIEYDVDMADDPVWGLGFAELFGARLDSSVGTLIYRHYVGEDDATPGSAAYCWAIDWCLWHECYEALPDLLKKQEKLADAECGTKYLTAVAWRRLKRDSEAATAAAAVFAGDKASTDERKDAADAVAELWCIDWAEKEYRRIIAESDLADFTAIACREALAMWLHDRDEFAAAVKVLAEVDDAVRDDPDKRQAIIAAIAEVAGGDAKAVEYLGGLAARQHLFAACEAEAAGDAARQRTELEAALAQNQDDPDVLIALYRLPNESEALRKNTLFHLQRATREFRRAIDDRSDYRARFAQNCNQYAWLVSNTEGNFEDALEMSLESLRVRPDEPSFLDTLGRCYYAAGKLEDAVKTQRRACQLAPHVRVMQRQLKIFEKELAARGGKGQPLKTGTPNAKG